MSEPRLIRGAAALLFERLTDLDPGRESEVPPQRLLDSEGLRASIAGELGRLLNTRAPVPSDVLARRRRSTIDYGIPDLTLFAPGDPAGEALLAAMVTEAIAVFEPRLGAPRARIKPVPGRNGALIVEVEGELQIGEVIEAVSFAVAIDGRAKPDG